MARRGLWAANERMERRARQALRTVRVSRVAAACWHFPARLCGGSKTRRDMRNAAWHRRASRAHRARQQTHIGV